MPELPDVETLRRYFDATALHQDIGDVEVLSRQVLEETNQRKLEEGLAGHSFKGTRRHGKYMFAGLDSGGWLVLHFGMTGDLKYFKDMQKDPEHDRLLVSFTNGYHLAYVSQRKLGEVRLIEDVDAFVEAKELGPDAMSDDLDQATFKELMGSKRGMVKSALMDQSTIAGIGNVYSDEILFQAGIHPRMQVGDLDETRLETLYREMRQVLEVAIDRQAQPADLPEDYLLPHRDPDGLCPRCGQPLKQVKVSSRTAYYCPNRQGEV
jgi:formamidopyrimidine-DNA glycosylase